MRQLTDDIPKPMIEVAGTPLIGHVLERLSHASFDRFCIVTGHKAEILEEYVRSLYPGAVFVRQTVADGTARAALLGREFAADEPFLLTFGDILAAPEDYRGMWQALDGVDAVVGVKHVDDPWQGAAVYEENGRVIRIVEKPSPGTSTTHWNSAGLYTFRADIFDELAKVTRSERGEYELTSAVVQMIERGKHLRLYSLSAGWRDVGRPEDLAAAAELLGE